jgi:AcrR family transcriptional regulator
MAAAARPPESKRLSREDWIIGAIYFLASNNVDALRVDLLAKELLVTKGSFYWHFSSREDLLDAVLESWRETMINNIEAWLRTTTGTPVGRLKRLLRIAISPRVEVPGGPLELTLRDWARRDAKVDAVIRQVDAQRMQIVKDLYRAAGFDEEKADAHALLHMTFVIGGRMMLFNADPDQIGGRWRIGETYLLPASPASDA